MGNIITRIEDGEVIETIEYDDLGRLIYQNDYDNENYFEKKYDDLGRCNYRKWTYGNDGREVIESFIEFYDESQDVSKITTYKTEKSYSHFDKEGLPIN